MRDSEYDDVRFVVALKRVGRKARPDYIAEVVSGYYPPSRKLALAMEEVTGIDAGEILTYPYRAKRAR